MNKTENIFLGKKILIYGLGKSGISSYKFLKSKSLVYLFDDNFKNNFKLKKKITNLRELFILILYHGQTLLEIFANNSHLKISKLI